MPSSSIPGLARPGRAIAAACLAAAAASLCLAAPASSPAAPAAAASPTERALQDLQAPATALRAIWPGVPDRTLVAWTTWRADENTTAQDPDQGAIDLDLAVLESSTGRVLQRAHQRDAWTSDAMHFDGISLDTANYAIAPGRRAFGLRVRSHHQGCAGWEGEALRLFEVRGAGLAQLTDEDLLMKETAAWCDCSESREVTRTLAIAPTTTNGRSDLLLRERRVERTGRASADGGECTSKETRTSRQALLRFDGQHYAAPPAWR